ncbi:MAG: T9SS type A sorting domain-containing protein, partial [Candidatus Marinimicrobia bacterium]|nr:T9SS type A sorting domain-containing protein [Candidatus Neomarinimicrobiota bacterium]
VLPTEYSLGNNYPNPFNPITKFTYSIPEDVRVRITVYDIQGRAVKTLVDSDQSAGYKSIQWNATNNAGAPVSAGLYFYRIQSSNFSQTKKMIFLK